MLAVFEITPNKKFSGGKVFHRTECLSVLSSLPQKISD
jgi:hypothetical protein